MAADEPSPSALFANVRSKLSNFHAADFLPTFSFLKKKTKSTTLKPNWSQNNGIEALKTLSTPVKSHQNFNRQVFSLEKGVGENGPVLESSIVSTETDSDLSEKSSPVIRPDLIGLFATTLSQEVTNCAINSIFSHNSDAFRNEDGHHDFVGAAENYSSDTLEFQHFGTLHGLKTLGKRAPAIGHEFEIAQLVNPSFCDKCGDFIWGLYKQAVRCQNCNYTCHYKCQLLVTLDCRSLSDSSFLLDDDDLNRNKNATNSKDTAVNNATDRTALERVVECTDAEMVSLRLLIDEYNHHIGNLKMTFDDNGKTFHGFIQISINLSRPVSIVAGEKPSSIYDVLNPDSTLKSGTACASTTLVDPYAPKTITSFFLPRNSMKILHIGSETTTRHMIAALLKKFKVADNPFKFALYERDTELGQTLKTRLRRFPDDGYPLRTLLSWGYQTNNRFVLQENDTGDILWHYFEAPELQNFLTILDKEEKQYIADIKKRYDEYRFNIQCELQDRGHSVSYAEHDEDETTRRVF